MFRGSIYRLYNNKEYVVPTTFRAFGNCFSKAKENKGSVISHEVLIHNWFGNISKKCGKQERNRGSSKLDQSNNEHA